jgi:hypothetical protein
MELLDKKIKTRSEQPTKFQEWAQQKLNAYA